MVLAHVGSDPSLQSYPGLSVCTPTHRGQNTIHSTCCSILIYIKAYQYVIIMSHMKRTLSIQSNELTGGSPEKDSCEGD